MKGLQNLNMFGNTIAMKLKISFYLMIFSLGFGQLAYCQSFRDSLNKWDLYEISQKEATVPIRPGKPGERLFWNIHAKRFMYAPAFDFKVVKNAVIYRYEILCTSDSIRYTFNKKVPYAALSPVWAKMPVGTFSLKVVGLSTRGDSLGLSGEGIYYRAAVFNGPYLKAVMPYDSSGILALKRLLHESYVNYWLIHGSPDSLFSLYRYPAKMFSAVISGAVAYARIYPKTEDGKRAEKLARVVANYLIKISFPKGDAWEYFPPTYYGPWINKLKLPSWMQLDDCMPTYGVNAGNAYLSLYDLTRDKRYLQAAERIAQTYLKQQLKNGTWYLYADPKTGNPRYSSNNLAIPIVIIEYLDRLARNYKMTELNPAIQKSLAWTMSNPVKTFNWQAQFEDVGPHKPYVDMSKREACELAIYLFKNSKKEPGKIRIAEDLVRYAEDQFVIWENPQALNKYPNFSWLNSTNWISPSAQEQYNYWVPVTFSAYILIKTFFQAYLTTQKRLYLAKALSLANAMTVMQKANGGSYSAYFTKHPIAESDQWINCIVYPAEGMIFLGKKMKMLHINY